MVKCKNCKHLQKIDKIFICPIFLNRRFTEEELDAQEPFLCDFFSPKNEGD